MKVHIVEDHDLVVKGYMAHFENTEIEVVGVSRNGFEFLDWLKENRADIFILDISMQGMDGLEVLNELSKKGIELQIIVVSSYNNIYFLSETINNGASGYVSKNKASECILEALETVINGGVYFSKDIQEMLILKYLEKNESENKSLAKLMLEKSLSKQEMKILAFETKKLDTSEIAKELNIKPSTVRSYRQRIREKLIPEILRRNIV